MDNVKPEEKSPLLLYLVDGDGDVSKNNKRVNFDKGRLYGISSGATAVFAEFPNYISPCWITTLLSSLIFLMMVLLMVSSMESSKNLRIPRCTHSHFEDQGNKTIHLVHELSNWNDEELDVLEKIKNEYDGYKVHLILLRPGTDGFEKNIITKLPLMLKVLKNSSETDIPSSDTTNGVNEAVIEIKKAKRITRGIRGSKRKKREHSDKNGPMAIGMGVKSLLDILLHSRMDGSGNAKRLNRNDTHTLPQILNLTELFPTQTTQEPRPKTLDDVLCNFPGIIIQNISFEEAFFKSPLEKNWFHLNHDLTIFALRIVHLWQFGGLSFKIDGIVPDRNWDDVENFSVAPEITLRSAQNIPILPLPSQRTNKLLNFISNGKAIFDGLPKDVVTADDDGLHIFTKTPCHVFFGEVLMNLKHARGHETPKSIIQKSLKVFCKHSAVGQNYCQNMIRRRG